jgi:hypothetical protein
VTGDLGGRGLLLLVLAAWPSAAGCDGGEADGGASRLAPPERSAAQDQAVRALLANVGEARLCDALEGRLMALPAPATPQGPSAGLAPAEGRLWVEGCRAERRGQRLALHIEGRGWTWVDQSQPGPLGSRFGVQGLLRFRAAADLEGAVDVGYAEEPQVVTLWYSPVATPTTTFDPIGEVPVRAQGGWSGIIGTVGELLGGPLDRQARPAAAQAGAEMMAGRLDRGFTATADLCSGQVDVALGALGSGQRLERPYPADGTPWLANEAAKVRPGAIDAAGPWPVDPPGLRVDVELQRGGAAEVRLLCRREAQQVLEAFIDGQPAGPVAELRREILTGPGRRTSLALPSASCPVAMIVTPDAQATEPTELRYRVVRLGARAEALVRCAR